MAVYNPADPFNWQGIDAELRARAAGPNPDGSTRYDLPGMGMDPMFIAYQAQYDANRTGLDRDRTLRKTRAQLDYEQALRDLEQQGLVSARDTDTSLLSRGVYRSGERTERQNDLGLVLGEGRQRADATLADQTGQVDADYERALTQLNADREMQVVQSKSRVADAQRTGAADAGMLAGGGATSAPPAGASSPRPPAGPSTTPPRPSSIPGSPGYVHDAIRPPTSSRPATSPPKPGSMWDTMKPPSGNARPPAAARNKPPVLSRNGQVRYS